MKVRKKATWGIITGNTDEKRTRSPFADLLSSHIRDGTFPLGPVTRFIGQAQVGFEVAGVRLLVENAEDGFRVSRLFEVQTNLYLSLRSFFFLKKKEKILTHCVNRQKLSHTD